MTWIDGIFVGCAVLGGVLFLIRVGFLVFGGGLHGDLDLAHADLAHLEAAHEAGDTDVSFRLLSFQGITGFFLMFGLVGLALHRESRVSEGLSVVGALAAGVVTLYVIGKLFAFMRNLQSSGTLNLQNAVGQEGSVYLTIPARGTGKVSVAIQGGLTIFDAVSNTDETIKTGERVRVSRVIKNNVMLVQKL